MTMTTELPGLDPGRILIHADGEGLPPITLAQLRYRTDVERTLRPGRERARVAGRILPYLPGLLDLVEQRDGSGRADR